MKDLIKYYDLEKYLFEDVNQKFHEEGFIDAFDFFCILIWKAERAKIYHVRRFEEIIEKGEDYEGIKTKSSNLEAISQEITKRLFNATDNKDRMKILIKNYHFQLPTASAILSVFYPDQFTVYDIRVCEQLDDFYNLDNKKFENRWEEYLKYIDSVKKFAGITLSLRDKDRYLWAKSFKEQLEDNIKTKFLKENTDNIK